MKMVMMSVSVAASALSASTAQAFEPPYYIEGNAYTGKATVQSAGGCKTKATYENAQYGNVYDSLDDFVGWGMVSSEGQLLALEESYQYLSGFEDSATFDSRDAYYENMASSATIEAIETAAGCDIGVMITSSKSTESYIVDPDKSLDGLSLQFIFNGFTEYTTEVDGTKSTYKSLKFNGKITFKGARPLV